MSAARLDNGARRVEFVCRGCGPRSRVHPLGVGYYIKLEVPNFEEFLVAGCSMTTPILVCTLASTYSGLDVLFGTSEMAFGQSYCVVVRSQMGSRF